MNAQQLVDKVQSLVTVGRVLSKAEVAECWAIAAVANEALRSQVLESGRGHRAGAVLACYACDGWSAKLQERTTASAGEQKVKRDGKVRHEFLLQHMFVRTRKTSGHEELTFLSCPPLPLTHGKTAWNAYSAAISFHPSMRAVGWQGIVWQFYVFDGLQFQAMKRRLRAMHHLEYDGDMNLLAADVASDPIAQLTHFNICMRCKSHTTHLAVTWSLKPVLLEGMSKDAHNVVRSLRSNAHDLHSHVEPFMRQCVQFVEKTDDPVAVESFWRLLGVHPGMLKLVCMVDPVWDGQSLFIADRMSVDPDGWRKTKVVLLYLLRWCDWSDTRWLKSSKSARWYMRSLFVGLDKLVALVLQDPHCYKMWLRGHDRSSIAIRTFFTVACVAPMPAEAVHACLMKDDRLLRFGADYKAKVPEQLTYIATLPSLVWVRLASTLQGEHVWQDVRSMCLKSASVCAAFLYSEVFADLEQYPFCLCQGDIAANLQKLQNTDPATIAEETTVKLHRLLTVGYDRAELICGVELLRDAACTVNCVEQAHASGAVLVKGHECYSSSTLVHRASLHILRSLFALSPHEKKVRHIEARMGKLRRLQPEKVAGRHLFMRSLACEAQLGIEKSAVFTKMTETMNGHGNRWHELSLREKQVYDGMARRTMLETIEM